MPAAADIRAHLIRALEADLVGPFDPNAPDETLPLAPSRWYLTGFLAPAAARETNDATSDEELSTEPEDEEDDAGAAEPEPKQRNIFPASMGLSVLVSAATKNVRATVTFAEYVCEARQEEGRKRTRNIWRRAPRGPYTEVIPLDAKALEDGIELREFHGVKLRGRLAPAEVHGLPAGTRALSLFIVNERTPAEERADERFLFQVQLSVECEGGFVPRPNRRDETADDWDDKVGDLQFRNRLEWAVGHNVAVVAPEQDVRVSAIRTTWLPKHDVRRVVTNEDVPGVETSMDALADLADGASARAVLTPLRDAYETWIAGQRTIKLDSKPRLDTRAALMDRAAEVSARIREGIDRLATDSDLFEAFRLANRAMAMSARQRSPDRYDDTRKPQWRLFQLAFLLLNLAGLADPTHEDRARVELIFFPTGGGKTEAYLGVIATALILRRIKGRERPDAGLGVAVLLRYTLRLLTLDQLSRAATLVCALEVLRRERPALLGDVRFAVGLWVGKSATANTMAQVKEKIVEYKNSASKTAASPCPLTSCPWCGHPLGPDSLSLVPSPQRPESVVVACTSPSCAFCARHEPAGIPLLFVDEPIYRELPCFLVATVDKFAMLPWRGETGMLFGRATARSGRSFFGPLDGAAPRGATLLPDGLHPPELIVQDELHLISGPLGTMVGLYETAIEHLCVTPTTRPKIIASTATVRRARDQIRSLFGRQQMTLFPPPGVDDGETFFARVGGGPGRTYVGVAAPGRSIKAILLRTYVDLLCAAQHEYDPNSPVADPYMTVAGYFNSIRELGGMRRLVEDEVRTRAHDIEQRTPIDRKTGNPWFKRRGVQAEPVELTSRETTAKIAAAKARLAATHESKEHVDVLLASNMISVGVDIDRLGLMVIAGQPKATSEYIQASSRVGRQHPGLVVTCFNVRKPRDRSHYERFCAYHASFYRFVEAQSLTPFSLPALERGLAGTLVAMTRLSDIRATAPDAVMRLAMFRAVGEAAVKKIADRAGHQPSVSGADFDRTVHGIVDRGKNLLDAWDRYAKRITSEAAGKLRYSPYDQERANKHLLHTVTDDEKPAAGSDEAKFVAPTSMRDVEPGVHLWIQRGRLGGRR